MVLSRALTRLATSRPRVHLLEAPGGALLRALLEDELDRRGWAPATSPAAADALVLAGDVPDSLATAADLLWSQLPGPRARGTVRRAEDAGPTLDGLRDRLRDADRQRADARSRPRDAVTPWLPEQDHEEGEDHDHGGHDHGAMAPGGVPLAGGDEDRDGLEMDVLVHPLGPLLDHWPGGLELRATLHGDVVGDAEVRWWRAGAAGRDDPAPGGLWAAYDAVATTLALAGDEPGARAARQLRRAAGTPDGPATRPARLAARVERWRRWQVLPPDCAAALAELLDGPADEEVAALGPAELAYLVVGRDLGDVRLLVAVHAPRLRRGADLGATHGARDD